MALKDCDGNARLAERVFGWGRVNVEVGLAEKRTGIVCLGAQSGYGGAKRWEEKQLGGVSPNPRKFRQFARCSIVPEMLEAV